MSKITKTIKVPKAANQNGFIAVLSPLRQRVTKSLGRSTKASAVDANGPTFRVSCDQSSSTQRGSSVATASGA